MTRPATLSARLGQFARELAPRDIHRAMRAALRKEARRIRASAARQLRASPVRYTAALARGIRGRESRRDACGLYVTLKASRRTLRGMHLNRQGRLRPVLVWLNGGTAARRTRRGHDRGSIDAVRFIERTDARERPTAQRNIVRNFDAQISKIARKHGLL